MNMIERVARVLCTSDGRDPDEKCAGEGAATAMSWLGWQAFAADAETLLAAMREPTDGMAMAGRRQLANRQLRVDGGAGDLWREMIDAARSDR